MITRRIIGLGILALIIIIGILLYFIVKKVFNDVESDNIIMKKKDIKGKKE